MDLWTRNQHDALVFCLELIEDSHVMLDLAVVIELYVAEETTYHILESLPSVITNYNLKKHSGIFESDEKEHKRKHETKPKLFASIITKHPQNQVSRQQANGNMLMLIYFDDLSYDQKIVIPILIFFLLIPILLAIFVSISIGIIVLFIFLLLIFCIHFYLTYKRTFRLIFDFNTNLLYSDNGMNWFDFHWADTRSNLKQVCKCTDFVMIRATSKKLATLNPLASSETSSTNINKLCSKKCFLSRNQ